jgi:hypothetical protein
MENDVHNYVLTGDENLLIATVNRSPPSPSTSIS